MKRIVISLGLAVALVVTSVALAAAPKSGTYSGKTGQRLNITIKVSTKQSVCGKDGHKAPCVTDVRYKAIYRCTDSQGHTGTSTPQPTELGATNIKNGKADARFGNSSDDIHFKATFNGKKVSGSFVETYRSRGGSTCRSGTVKFTAKHP
jgi:hypothetical protein